MDTKNKKPILKRKRVQIMFDEPSLTEQTHSQSCDINYIVKKFTETGILPTRTYENPQYGFAPEIDFKSALDLVKNTQREFDELSDTEKALFGNNSGQYAEFLTNYEEDAVLFEDDIEAKPDTSVSQTAKDSKESDSDGLKDK